MCRVAFVAARDKQSATHFSEHAIMGAAFTRKYIDFPHELNERIVQHCKENNVPQNQFIRKAVENELNRNNEPKTKGKGK